MLVPALIVFNNWVLVFFDISFIIVYTPLRVLNA
jgi:hypothetical protein